MAIHPFLQPAVSDAVEKAVVETKGAPTAPTTDELQKLITQHAALINQQSTVIQQQQAAINAFPQLLADAIGLNNAQFVTPGLQAIVGGTLPGALDSLKEFFDKLQADEVGAMDLLAAVNADRTRFAQLEPLVAGLGTSLTALTTTVGTKAAAADLSALVSTVSTKAPSADVAALATTVAGKAASSDVAALQGLVNTNTANIAANTAALVDKALASDLTALSTVVNSKATSTAVAALTDTVNGKASATDLLALTTTVASKALAADLITTNNNVAANTTAINLRATTASVTALQAAVTQNTTDIAARATTAALSVQTGRVDTLLTSTVPGLQTDIGNRLRKDVADSTTFPLGVPAAPSMDKAVQKSELAGGIQRPYRIYQNVGTTPVSAYLRGSQQAQIVDALGLGQVYVLATVRIKTIVAPTLASTISLYKNGSSAAFYSQVVALTNIPAVGKVLDILTLSTSLPADIALPATITASSSAGTFEIIIDGVLK